VTLTDDHKVELRTAPYLRPLSFIVSRKSELDQMGYWEPSVMRKNSS
jgi:hypothetical protein